MIDLLIAKTSGRLKFLYRHSNFFNLKLRKDLCSALVQCHLDYCVSSWFTGLSKACQHKLHIVHNRMICFILGLSPRDHVGPSELHNIKLLNFQSRAQQLRLNHMFSIFHQTAPGYLNQFFNRVSSVHSHATRASSLNFHIPKIKGIAFKTFYALINCNPGPGGPGDSGD